MKTSIRAVLFAGTLLLLPTSAMAQSSERDAVNRVMQNFIRSFETGDANLMRTTFRSDGLLVGYSRSRGKVVTESTEEWSKGFLGKPADDEAQRKRSFEILDVTATGAVSKVTLDYPTWKGIDYISLSKIDGQWMIVSKSWSGLSKPTVAIAQSNEPDAVKSVMQNFIRAYETGDGNFMRKAFRSDGVMIGYSEKDAQIAAVSGAEFANRFDGKPGDDEAMRKRSVEILDTTESAALAKVTLNYPTWDGVDYIALSKIDGQWMIVSKSWSGQRKPKAP